MTVLEIRFDKSAFECEYWHSRSSNSQIPLRYFSHRSFVADFSVLSATAANAASVVASAAAIIAGLSLTFVLRPLFFDLCSSTCDLRPYKYDHEIVNSKKNKC
jgi:hypothetical protein